MIIGLDIGGTWMRGVGIENNRVLGAMIRTPKTLSEFKKDLEKLVRNLADNKKIEALGIGVAGKITPVRVARSRNIKYLNNFALKKFLSGKYRTHIQMDNDARCFLRAEIYLGQAKNAKSVLAVTLGTGLGGALALNGEIISGAHYTAGQISNIPFKNKELDDYASAKFLRRTGNDYKKMGENLGQGLATAANLYDPELIIIGGGIMQNKKASDLILHACQKSLKEGLRGPAKKVKAVASHLGDFAGALGAYFLVFR